MWWCLELRGELAWSDMNDKAWDYANIFTDWKHDFPHEESSEMIPCGFPYTAKICDATVLSQDGLKQHTLLLADSYMSPSTFLA